MFLLRLCIFRISWGAASATYGKERSVGPGSSNLGLGDEGKVEIERVNDEILKIIQASEEEELGFNKTWPFVSKLARSRPERKPI